MHVHVYTQVPQRSRVRSVPSVIHHTCSEQQGELGKHGRSSICQNHLYPPVIRQAFCKLCPTCNDKRHRKSSLFLSGIWWELHHSGVTFSSLLPPSLLIFITWTAFCQGDELKAASTCNLEFDLFIVILKEHTAVCSFPPAFFQWLLQLSKDESAGMSTLMVEGGAHKPNTMC